MNNSQDYSQLWATSKQFSESYWNHYNKLIGPIRFVLETEQNDSSSDQKSLSDYFHEETQVEDDNEVDDKANQEYQEFIRITRQHQLQRESLRKEREKLEPQVDEYYKDISQVNTLIEDNIAEIPVRYKTSKAKLEEKKLIDKYGSRESYNMIRSMEMCIDDAFRSKCQQLGPTFWPVIPLNPKPYLNKC